MRLTTAEKSGPGASVDRIGDLTAQINRLVHHRAYTRDQVVSSMLTRFLPSDVKAWRGPEDLRRRIEAAALDARAMDYLCANVATELAMAHARG